MRAFPTLYPDLLSTSHRVLAQVSSHRAGRLLASSIPVTSGTLTYDDTAQLRRRCAITVPLSDPQTGISWDPGDEPDHPLNWYGQRLHIVIGIGLPTGGSVWFDHGWYLIQEWSLNEQDATVDVTGVDLSQLIDDDRHYTTETPQRGISYENEFRRLLDGQVPMVVHGGLPARTVNPQTVWDRSRRKNLDDLCKAWPARWFIGDDGAAHVAPPLLTPTAATPVDTVLEWGEVGTVTGRERSGERGRLYNAVIVQGKASEDGSETQPWGGAEIRDVKSPIRIQGPFGKRPMFYQSDLITTTQQCLDTAESMLAEASRISRTEPITAVPDYALELGDVVQIRTKGEYFTGRVQALELPLTAGGGAMTVTVSTQPPENDEEGGE